MNGYEMDFGDRKLLLQPQTAQCVRIVWQERNVSFRERPVFVLPHQFDGYTVDERADRMTLTMPDFTLTVSRGSGLITFRRKDGTLLMEETEKKLSPCPVLRRQAAGEAVVETIMTADGMKAHVADSRREVERMAWRCMLKLRHTSKGLFGLGSHEDGFLNLRGRHRYLYQHNFKALVPHLVSEQGFSLLMDTGSSLQFDDDGAVTSFDIETDDALSYYFCCAGSMDGITAVYRELTGAVPMLPKWAFGYAQSKEHYHTQQELLDVAAEYRRRHIPLDLVVQDWYTWRRGLWGEKIPDPERYPDLQAATDALHDMHLRLMFSIWPNMSGDGENRKEMLAHGYMLANESTYDAFRPEARALYFRQTDDTLFSRGVDAWWCDCTEPMEADWRIRERLPDEVRYRVNTEELCRYLPPEQANLYPFYHMTGIYEEQRKRTDAKRVVTLTRASWAGQQRFSAILWSGDVAASWRELKTQIAEGLNFTATGFPYWTNDIGAFFPEGPEAGDPPGKYPWYRCGCFNKGVQDPGYREFYTRWLQYAVFLPMFRSHGTTTPREIWQFGEKGTPFYDAIEASIRLRYSLIDYIYALSAGVTRRNGSLMRCLAFDFAGDDRIYGITDEYMFGDLLVCPVTEPMYFLPGGEPIPDAARERRVYLPAGCGWYDLRDHRCYAGGCDITAPADLSSIPVYVRAGSIIPVVMDAVEYAEQKPEQPRELRFYEGADGSFVWYRDGNDGYAYERGEFAECTVTYCDADRSVTLSALAGGYPGMERELPLQAVLFTRSDGQLRKPVLYTGEALTFRF